MLLHHDCKFRIGPNLADPTMLNLRQLDPGKLPKSLHTRELQGRAINGPEQLKQLSREVGLINHHVGVNELRRCMLPYDVGQPSRSLGPWSRSRHGSAGFGFGCVCTTVVPTVAATAAPPIPRLCSNARRLTTLREEMSASLKVLRSTRWSSCRIGEDIQDASVLNGPLAQRTCRAS